VDELHPMERIISLSKLRQLRIINLTAGKHCNPEDKSYFSFYSLSLSLFRHKTNILPRQKDSTSRDNLMLRRSSIEFRDSP
jgi:hypothetical protein